ncbi:PREDICTED: uncharacterized protein LOC109581760 isoform X2 [Amphimedon queenslandica]|uniref:Calx-beta domain-containing protein n=1 Tax=Amphimedon queenslandica TaxID=400682 RepID=A0AAN0J4N1_AMPQE|nr:PREDICTED: uncharacterized protein LOC109581760 isoform X2 [Amphimedon queenslandica]|eukprot:XP_019851707.1 PREDICTED: uncharacterized protein LOC109581760 isoform X2 [Amphimedon queenslandica]
MFKYLIIFLEFIPLIVAPGHSLIPTFSFEAAMLSVSEGDNSVEVCISAHDGNSPPYVLNVSTDGDAALHSDYVVPDPFDFTFPVTDISVCNNVTIVNDRLSEKNETLILTIPSSSSGSYELGSITTLTITIVDDDDCPSCKDRLFLFVCKNKEMRGDLLPLPCSSLLAENP